MVYRIRSRGLRIKPIGLFRKEMVYRIRSRGLRIKPIGLFYKEMVFIISAIEGRPENMSFLVAFLFYSRGEFNTRRPRQRSASGLLIAAFVLRLLCKSNTYMAHPNWFPSVN